MSEELGFSKMEKEELASRLKAMTEEELKFVAKIIPDGVLFDELDRRYFIARNMMDEMRRVVRIHTED